MHRTTIIQAILDQRSNPAYLEIGVVKGQNFFPIRSREKIAVDPHFNFSTFRKAIWILGNNCNWSAKYYQDTSDAYLSNPRRSIPPDVNNSLRSLKDDGAIVMHDSNPPHAAAAHPAESYEHAASLNLPGWTGEWCGNVWKSIALLRSSRKDLRVSVLDCDSGVGIITRGKPDDSLSLLRQDIDRMTFEDFSQN